MSSQDLPGKAPVDDQVPTEDEGYQLCRAAGKLQGKKALITGGDSRIGRAVAIFAMEGAESLIPYLAHEGDDAGATKKKVEEYSGVCYLCPSDVTSPENCQKVVDEALSKMGTINIFLNKAAFQVSRGPGTFRISLSVLTCFGWYRKTSQICPSSSG